VNVYVPAWGCMVNVHVPLATSPAAVAVDVAPAVDFAVTTRSAHVFLNSGVWLAGSDFAASTVPLIVPVTALGIAPGATGAVLGAAPAGAASATKGTPTTRATRSTEAVARSPTKEGRNCVIRGV